jgi:hypothetical protein
VIPGRGGTTDDRLRALTLEHDQKFMRASRAGEPDSAKLANTVNPDEELPMTRFVTLAAVSMLTLAGASAIAQTPPPSQAQSQDQSQDRRSFGRAEMDSLTDARIASIQAGLKLTPEQQALWPPVEQAIRGVASERAARFENRREARDSDREPGDFMERIERQSDRAMRYAQPLDALSKAMRPLWNTLDERQKRLLPVLIRPSTEFAARRAEMRERRADRMDRDGRGDRGGRGERGGGGERGGRPMMDGMR